MTKKQREWGSRGKKKMREGEWDGIEEVPVRTVRVDVQQRWRGRVYEFEDTRRT